MQTSICLFSLWTKLLLWNRKMWNKKYKISISFFNIHHHIDIYCILEKEVILYFCKIFQFSYSWYIYILQLRFAAAFNYFLVLYLFVDLCHLSRLIEGIHWLWTLMIQNNNTFSRGTHIVNGARAACERHALRLYEL